LSGIIIPRPSLLVTSIGLLKPRVSKVSGDKSRPFSSLRITLLSLRKRKETNLYFL